MTRAHRISSECDDVDAVIISNGTSPFLDPVFWYVTEQTSGSFEGTFAIVKKGDIDVVTHAGEATTAKRGKGKVHVYETRDDKDKMLTELLKGCPRIGISGRSIAYSTSEYFRKLTGSELVDVSDKIANVIAVKDRKEIADIRIACDISSKVADMIPSLLYSGMTEKEAAWLIDSELRKKGGNGNAFGTIAAFGENAAEPHHVPSDRKLRKGDAALFDFGSKHGMYCSDLTRTVFFGTPDGVLKRAYDLVLRAKEAGMNEMRDGVPSKNADSVARKMIDESEFKNAFVHSFGHGMGMNVHELPSLSSRSEAVLRKGMVMTAEPGIYLPGIGGIRIEDTVLVKEKGIESLTGFDQSYTVI